MSKTAFLCSGQGAQQVGMGVDFVHAFPAVADLFEVAEHASGTDIFSLCMNGPLETLSLTQNTQPALVTVSLSIASALKEKGITPDAVAGFSLGEYAAYAIAGMVDDETALQLVSRRGAMMAHAANQAEGGMAALLRCDLHQAAELCEKHATATGKVLVPANLNCPGQIVISGDIEALDAAREDWQANKGRCTKLATSGAFHSPLMMRAAQMTRPALEGTLFMDPQIPLYCNVTAQPVTAKDAIDTLYRQIYSPVLWEDTIRNMIDDGIDTFIECGPGKVLTGMAKRTAKDMGASVELISVATVEELEAVVGGN